MKLNQPRIKTTQNFKLNSLLKGMNLVVDAQATSTNGRWKIILGAHTRNGLACFDVLAVRVVDFFVDAHHFSCQDPDNEGTTYDEQRDRASKAARRFYEDLVVKMQEPSKGEESDERASMEITNPDGTKEKYTIN